jgi:SNF2 family DNA or RNA helicase
MHFTPKIQLYEHQQQAVDWITTQEARYPSGGILAHDMGLGKTIDVLYHIANQTSDTIGNNLIVVPNNLLHQWGEEFHKYIEDCTRYDFIQYTTKTRSQNIREYRIVVTTYDTLISDYRKNIGDVLDFEWTRVFLDEAHEIRNSRSLRFGVINYIRAKTKWCLTGTPIWNSEKDIYSLKTFIGGLDSDLVDKSYLHIRTKDIYTVDDHNISSEVAEWAIKHGDNPNMRIVMAGYEHEHTFPSSWRKYVYSVHGGYGNQAEQGRGRDNKDTECLWFSPYCIKPVSQLPMFSFEE